MFTRRSTLTCLVSVLVIAAVLAGCGHKETREVQAGTPPSLMQMASVQPTAHPSVQPKFEPTLEPTLEPTVQPTIQPTVRPTPTLFVPEALFDPGLDIRAGPVNIPLELQIPSLKVDAPVVGVGLTSENVMDSPKGPIGDANWRTAFWYRGSGIPGDTGTATIAGHVNNPLGQPEIFAHLLELQPGDLIIIHDKKNNLDIHFMVDQIEVYSIQESSTPEVLTKIYGAGPVAGTGPQPAPDGLSHLTLITCAGNIVNGYFDHHTVVYATRSK